MSLRSGVLGRAGLWLTFIWLAVLSLTFYLSRLWPHGPVIRALGDDLVDVFAVVALTTLGGAIGTLLLRENKFLSLLEIAALRGLLGLGLISLTLLLIGLVGRFPTRWLGWAITVAALILLYRSGRAWLREVGHGVRNDVSAAASGEGAVLGRFGVWVMVGAVALLVLTLSRTLAPPTQWDSLAYHLSGPQLYLKSGRIVAFPDLHYLGFPFLTEMLYLWVMLLGRAQAAVLLHGVFGVLGLMMVIGVASRLGRPVAGWLAVLTMLLGYGLWSEFHYAYSDLSLLAYIVGAFLLLNIWGFQSDQRQTDRTLIQAGVFMGFAMGAKYTGLASVIGLGVLTLWMSRRNGIVAMLRSGIIVTASALITFLPWLIRNLLLYGNPVAPFIWGTVAFDALDHFYYVKPHSGMGLRSLLAPIESTLLGGTVASSFDSTPGPLLIGLLPLGLVGWRQRRANEQHLIEQAAVMIIPTYLLWLYGVAADMDLVSIRLIYAIFPLIALIGALGLEGLQDLDLSLALDKLTRWVVLFALSAGVVGAAFDNLAHADIFKVTAGLIGEDEYLTATLPAYYTAMQRVNSLPEESRVLLLWESRGFFCERDCIPDSLNNQWWHDHQLEPNPRRIAQRWREQGITHVLIFDAGINALLARGTEEALEEEDIAALDIVREKDLTMIWDGADAYNAYTLYELRP